MWPRHLWLMVRDSADFFFCVDYNKLATGLLRNRAYCSGYLLGRLFVFESSVRTPMGVIFFHRRVGNKSCNFVAFGDRRNVGRMDGSGPSTPASLHLHFMLASLHLHFMLG